MSELTFIGGLGSVAQQYGLEEAVLLHSCVYWWREHRAKRENYRDGRHWNHCSTKAFSELMPWWTPKQIRRILESCRNQGALLTGNYNERKDDKTLWYAPSDELLGYYGELPLSAPEANAQTGTAFAQMGTANAQMGKGSYNRYTCNNPCSNNPPTPQGECEGTEKPEKLFDEFWDAYPKKVSKAAARKAFIKLCADRIMLGRMLEALEAQKRQESWQRDGGRYIPYPATWLNGQRWEDETGPQARAAPRAAPAERFLGIQVIDGEEVAVYG